MIENVILVNNQDLEIGVEEKLKAHQNGGKRHRAFSILIFNDKNELMLQQRALSKYHCGGLRSNTCCGHPRPNEETEKAARRRLKEEMGFDCELKELINFNYEVNFGNGLTEKEFLHVFRGNFNGIPIPNPEEAESWRWISMDVLNTDIVDNPEKYTFWFKEILEEFNKH